MAPHERERKPALRRKDLRVLVPAGAAVLLMTGLVSYSPTLYRMFCALTGYGGTVQRAVATEVGKESGTAEGAAAEGKRIEVYFDAHVAPGLPWEFRPETREVKTRLGEPTKVYYYARNNSDETVVARATFNVTPYKAAKYFFKIECFCFTEEKLGPGESARLPLVLYVDEQAAKDPNTQEVDDFVLSYTFFRQKDLSAEETAQARDLKRGSAELDAELGSGGAVGFDNDAPRR